MADEKEEVSKALNEAAGKGGKMRIIVLIAVSLVIVGVSAGAAAVVGKVMASSSPAAPPKMPTTAESAAPVAEPFSEQFTYYDFEPIIVNLDEPRLARYVRATVVLAVRKEEFSAAKEHIENKKPELKSWLTVYLSGCTLEDMRGRRNLNRIRREIEESLNDQLWHNGKPMIDHVLFKEIAIQ